MAQTVKKLYIYGAGGHSQVVAGIARLHGFEIMGFLEDGTARHGQIFDGAPILSGAELPETCAVFLAFGDCRRRLALGRALDNGKREFPTLIHPSAAVAAGVKLGRGLLICAHAVIDPGCEIGDFAIVNNNATVCHGSVLGAGCHICPGAVLAGNVRIGECSWIGLGSRVIEKIRIARDVLVGAGATIIRDAEEASVIVGVPGKCIRKQQLNEEQHAAAAIRK